MISIKNLVGLRGVHPDENRTAKKWGARFEKPMLIAVLWIPVQIYLESTGDISQNFTSVFDWLIWALFLTEGAVLTTLVSNKKRYITQNWMNVVIVISSLPMLWDQTPVTTIMRFIRLVFMMGIMSRLFNTTHSVLRKNHLGSTLALALVFVVISGSVIFKIDPEVKSIADGVWWALATVTTIGYGDVVPHSNMGRLFGGVLILLGVALFSHLTANISAFLISRGVKEEERMILDKIRQMEGKLQSIEQSINNLGNK